MSGGERKRGPGPGTSLALAGGALLLLAVLSVGVGSTTVGFGDALRIVAWKFAGAGDPSPSTAAIVWDIRLPRTVLALLVGGSLAVAGVLMQAFFRNALAGPFVVGVSSGAAFGAVLAMVLGWDFVILGISSLPLAAFAGGLGVILLVVAIHGRGHGSPVESLLLTGLAVGSILSAAASLVMVTSQEPLQAILFWLLGSLSSARWLHVASVLPFFLVAGTAAWLLARDLDVLVWGDDTSRALGISVRRVRVLVLVIATLLASAAVAVSGIIGFLGLMTPHIARFLVGASHRRLIPMSLILGASLLLAADMGARTLWAPVELPIGAVTALVGAPFLAYLANRRG